ncbi:MAG: DMT family transporter [Candidatus Diapherotrites archaeon]|nr:DMT family transporter [Candidatus Diapherotrites archaeon]
MNAYLFVVATAVISGVSIFLNKFGVSGMDPFVFTSLKNALVATVLLSGLALVARLDVLRNLSEDAWKKLILLGLVGGSVPFLLFFWGLSGASAASAAFIHKTMFVWVGLLAFFFLGERLTRVQVLASGLLFAGVALFSAPSLSLGLPELAILAATLLWSAEVVIAKKALKEVPASVVAWGRMFFGSLVLTGFLLLTGGIGSIASLGLSEWCWIAVTSVLLCGYVFTWYSGLAGIPATHAAAVLVVGSVITTALSAVLLGTAVPATELAGYVMVLMSVVLITVHVWAGSANRVVACA